ncbi:MULTISPECIES: Nramp family divalent metal transporter [unclassified Micromonospora]|uniref:Nramp family divalent metal transporter n=1 Tax=unclassified Micromonospora TaxID=2617518 RepID=UPI0003EECB2A|nr:MULTISPECIES: Nramp family divalent metal transporter [unclassified Micromonospora]EWM64606.1 H+-stimulated Mn2+/Fe2+ transporter, NRAMP family [Micromonospora sp. M42]MCK1806091.1 Nramp family divalent metal transporter [Micromonospora sp. R42106]MCK1830713.1 Nramp family divalent metal transporter [Micromonospora sp. R42003]MCK1845855.1 Nramp family divalent metal transporter [Micromonospora sp. R42004]MCM1015493.1 Nramp family divalent metal transporter [Micromonospora sp. XM-20-01]
MVTNDSPVVPPLRTARAARPVRGRLILLGPAFVAAVAYVDPGNFATNSTAGARYGYLLVWVVVAANLAAMLVQTLTAKLGLATGRSLPELCREHLPRPLNRVMWAQAELVAMATDLAEVIGGAVALYLLFGVPLLPGGLIVGAASSAILALRSRGFRTFEIAIAVLLGVIVLAFAVNLVTAQPDVSDAAAGLLPRMQGTDSMLLAAGILGATVMPHVIYVHSALTPNRLPAEGEAQRRVIAKGLRVDVLIALGVAGAVNLAMLLVAASSFHGTSIPGTDTLEGVHAGLATTLGTAAAVGFAVALLLSGLASTSVGTYAGEIIMQGFLRRRIPLLIRRMITLLPALAVLAIGVNPTRALVLSQVVLSFGIPFALIPVVMFTRRRDLMGSLVNRRATTAAAVAITAFVVALNAFLLWQVAA